MTDFSLVNETGIDGITEKSRPAPQGLSRYPRWSQLELTTATAPAS